MNSLTNRLLLLAVLSLCTSCVKDVLPMGMRNNSAIIPVVKSVSTKSGKTEVPHGDLLSTRVIAASDSLELIESVYEYGDLLNAPMTKGAATTTGSIFSNGGFVLDAYAESAWYDNTIADGNAGSKSNPNAAGPYFTTTVEVSNKELDKMWLNEVPISFWGSKDVTLSRTSSTTSTFDLTIGNTVSSQKDPVISFNKEMRSFDSSGEISDHSSTGGTTDEKINIRFFHPLSAVQFMKGELSGSYRISNITLQSIDSHTNCTVTSDPEKTPSENDPNLTFSHSSDTPVSFSQDYSAGDVSLERIGSTFNESDPKTFFMIPQNLSSASVKITFTDSNENETSSSFSLSGNWEDGKYYVYKIGLAGTISIGMAGLIVSNTCNVHEYIRAAVVANWVKDGAIVAPFNGSITSSWSPGSDGFYYYPSAIAAGESTTSPVYSAISQGVNPGNGAQLEVQVLVQAVGADGAASGQYAFQ